MGIDWIIVFSAVGAIVAVATPIVRVARQLEKKAEKKEVIAQELRLVRLEAEGAESRRWQEGIMRRLDKLDSGIEDRMKALGERMDERLEAIGGKIDRLIERETK